MKKTRVLIVDDQFLVRNLFELYLMDSEAYEVIGKLESAAYALEFVRLHATDLVIMDILMNDRSNGLAAAGEIKRLYPRVKILMVTSLAEVSWIKKSQEMGIDSFCYKDMEKEKLIEILERTMKGEAVYPDAPPQIRLGMIDSSGFTERELDVLRCMTMGLSNAEIAERLGIRENTVKTHIKSMLGKTGYANRTRLAIEARLSGVVVSLNSENQ